MDKKTLKIIMIVLILNFFALFFSIKSGLDKGDIMLRFRERQAITFLSALMLGISGMVSLVIYLLKEKMRLAEKDFKFWLFSSLGFFYLCLDEYFMGHEGIDELVGSLFIRDIKSLGLDGLVLGVFGVIALGICLYYRRELLRHKEILPFLFLGGIGLIGTVVFHQLENTAIVMEVIEESFKFIGVSFFFTGYLITLLSLIKRFPVSILDKS